MTVGEEVEGKAGKEEEDPGNDASHSSVIHASSTHQNTTTALDASTASFAGDFLTMQLANDKKALRARVDTAERAMLQLKHENRVLQKQVDQPNSVLEALTETHRKETLELQSKLENLEAHVSTVKAVNKELLEQNATLQKTTEALQETKTQQDQISQLQEILNNQPTLTELQLEKVQWKTQEANTKLEIKKLQQRDQQRQKKFLELEASHKVLQEQVETWDLEETKGMADIQELKSQLVQSQKETAQAVQSARHYQEKLYLAEESQQDMKDDSKRLQFENDRLISCLDSYYEKALTTAEGDDTADNDSEKDSEKHTSSSVQDPKKRTSITSVTTLQEKVISLERANQKLLREQQENNNGNTHTADLVMAKQELMAAQSEKAELERQLKRLKEKHQKLESTLSELLEMEQSRKDRLLAATGDTIEHPDQDCTIDDPLDLLLHKNIHLQERVQALQTAETVYIQERERLVTASANMSLTLVESRAKVDLLELQLEEAKQVAAKATEEAARAPNRRFRKLAVQRTASGRSLKLPSQSRAVPKQRGQVQRTNSNHSLLSTASSYFGRGLGGGGVGNDNNDDDSVAGISATGGDMLLTDASESSVSRFKRFFSRAKPDEADSGIPKAITIGGDDDDEEEEDEIPNAISCSNGPGGKDRVDTDGVAVD